MPWQNADSSMFEAYDYDPNMKVLHVKFRSSKEIRSYQGVEPHTALQFAEASSMGKFFHTKIRDNYKAL